MDTIIKLELAAILFLCFGCSKIETKISMLKIGKITEMKLGETAVNSKYGLSLRMESLDDYRCPKEVVCVWGGMATAAFHLKTKNGEYNFTLEKHGLEDGANSGAFITEGMKFEIVDVVPYPVAGTKQPQKTVIILVDNIN